MSELGLGMAIVGAILLLLLVCVIVGSTVALTIRLKGSLFELSIASPEKRRSDSNDDSDTPGCRKFEQK